MIKERDRTVITNTNVKKGLQVEVYNNFNQLKAIQQEWDDFVESVSGDIFLTYDWCRVWWKYYGKNRRLRIFVFRHEGALVGVIPLFIEKIWLGPVFVRAIKIVGSDFTLAQFSLPIYPEYIEPVIQSFIEIISKEKWDTMHIGPVAGKYKHFEKLRSTFDSSLYDTYYIFSKSTGVQTYFDLPDKWEQYLAGLKKKERQLIRSNYRKIQDKGMAMQSGLASAEDFNDKFSEFVRTHQLRWQELGKAGHFGDWPNSLEFHREVAGSQLKHGRLRLFEVRLSKDSFAYQYSYKCGQNYFEFLLGRYLSHHEPGIDLGRLLFAEQAQRAIYEGVVLIDSMRGKYEYKLRLGGKLFPIRSIYITRRRLYALVRVFVFRALSRFLKLCYYRIWYCRIAQKLPVKRHPLWRIWIKSSAFAS